MNIEIREFIEADKDSVLSLWTEVFGYDAPHNDPVGSIAKKTSRDPDLFLVASESGRVVGTVMGGYDGHRGWVYSLAVDKCLLHRGIGAALMEQIELKLRALGCLKVNLQIVASNARVVEFYEKLGYSVEERISMGKRLYC